MSIKYVEITIVKNLEEESILNKIFGFFNYNETFTFTDKDTIIMEFEDGTVCDTNYNSDIKETIKFGTNGILNNGFPIYIQIKSEDNKSKKNFTLFFKDPLVNDDNVKQINTDIMKQCDKLKHYKKIPSCINICYDMYDFENTLLERKDVLCIIKLKSSEDKPRYIVAYDEKVFDKPCLIYLIDCIFKKNFENEFENENITT